MGTPHRFESVEQAIAEITARRDDIDSVRIPIPEASYQVGKTVLRGPLMELRFCDGTGQLISREIAERLLNEGLLNRLRIPIHLDGHRQK